MIDSYIDVLLILLIFLLMNLLYLCGHGLSACKRHLIEYLQTSMRKKELQNIKKF